VRHGGDLGEVPEGLSMGTSLSVSACDTETCGRSASLRSVGDVMDIRAGDVNIRGDSLFGRASVGDVLGRSCRGRGDPDLWNDMRSDLTAWL
jgi:hypothetical protein